jgi:ferredoxin
MCKKIDIYWFSGSGNTLLLAMQLEEILKSRGKEVRLLPIEQTKPEDIDPEAMLGIVTAVAEQGTYILVWEFLQKLPRVDGTKTFLLDSMGYYSGGIVGPVKKILKRKGYNPFHAKEIIMPNIFYKKKKSPVKDELIRNKGLKKLEIFADKIIQERGLWIDIPFYSAAMSLVSRSHRMKNLYRKIIPVTFHDEKCTRCDLCVKLCPVGHISRVEDNAPVGTGETCIHCQRCYAYCPSNAITIGNEKNVPYRALKVKVFQEQLNRGI